MGYTTDWKPAAEIACRKCGEHQVEYREWEDSEGHEDYEGHCITCDHQWWEEGADA